MSALPPTHAAATQEPFYVSASRWRNFLLSHSASFRELQEERQRGWQSAALDAWYAARRQASSHTPRDEAKNRKEEEASKGEEEEVSEEDKTHAQRTRASSSCTATHSSAFDHADIPVLCERYCAHVRRIFACATRRLFQPGRQGATFLDLGCAPGGLSKYLLEEMHWSGVGVTLPQSEGGIVMDPALRSRAMGARYVLLEGDITTPPETWRAAGRHHANDSATPRTPPPPPPTEDCDGVQEGRTCVEARSHSTQHTSKQNTSSSNEDSAANVLGHCFWFVNGGAVQDYGQRLLLAQQQQQQRQGMLVSEASPAAYTPVHEKGAGCAEAETTALAAGNSASAQVPARSRALTDNGITTNHSTNNNNNSSNAAEPLSDRLGKRARTGAQCKAQPGDGTQGVQPLSSMSSSPVTPNTTLPAAASISDTAATTKAAETQGTGAQSMSGAEHTAEQPQPVTRMDGEDDDADAILPWFTLFVPQLRLALTHVCDGGGMMLVYGAPYCASLFILLRVLDTFTEAGCNEEEESAHTKGTTTLATASATRMGSPTQPAYNSNNSTVIQRGRNAGRLMSSMHSDMVPRGGKAASVAQASSQAKCVHILETMHIAKSPVYVLWERMRLMGNEAARARLLAALDPHSAALSPLLGGEDLPCDAHEDDRHSAEHHSSGLTLEERLQRKRAFWLGESNTGFALALEGFARHRGDLERIWQKTAHVLRVRRERAEQACAAQKTDKA